MCTLLSNGLGSRSSVPVCLALRQPKPDGIVATNSVSAAVLQQVPVRPGGVRLTEGGIDAQEMTRIAGVCYAPERHAASRWAVHASIKAIAGWSWMARSRKPASVSGGDDPDIHPRSRRTRAADQGIAIGDEDANGLWLIIIATLRSDSR